jgi:hypothetical protein
MRDYKAYGGDEVKELEETKKIYPRLTTFEQWLKRTGWVAK